MTRLRLGCAREPYMERSRMDEGQEEGAFDAAGDGDPSPNVHDKPLDAADGEDEHTCAPSGGVPDMLAPDGDDEAPGMAAGEDKARPMRYDIIYAAPVGVTVGGVEATVRHPPSWGCVRVERKGRRPATVALDDIGDDAARRALVSTRVRRRHELHPRCAVPGCGRAFRGWLNANTLMIENTRGETICGLGELAHKKCDLHDDGTAR